MLKSSLNPMSQLSRVRGMLHSLVDHPIAGKWARHALQLQGTELYQYLYSVAEACNPFERDDASWRSRCMKAAYTANYSGDKQRCALAAMFYLLSEGLYSQPTLPSLT